MDTNYSAHQSPQIRILSDQQIDKIVQATLECLHRTGVNVLNAEARDLLASAGAQVDGNRVRIPSHIIQDALDSAPRSFSLWGRDPKHQLELVADYRSYFGPGPTCTYVLDPETGQRRPTRPGDPGRSALVGDALANIDYVMGLGFIGDVPPELASTYEFAELLANTGKPILCWANALQNLQDIHTLALTVAGDKETLMQRPFFGLFTTFQSPLQHTDSQLSQALWAVEHGIPVIHMGGGAAGSTAPITGAGLAVIYLAGALSGLAIMQLKQPGARVCIGGVPQAMDLRTAAPAYGSPETSLYGAALADISRYLGIPFMGTAGVSESKTLDLQAAIESTIQVLMSGLSGATLVHDVGMLESTDLGSLEMLVMNDEIIAMTRRILRGMVVNEQTLMLDSIDEVGPAGEFVSTEETARQCRNEIWVPSLMDRQRWIDWDASGNPTMTDRIKARLQSILETHQPPPLPPGAEQKIRHILEAAELRLKSR